MTKILIFQEGEETDKCKIRKNNLVIIIITVTILISKV